MSIYDNGTQYPWEIWVGLAIAAVVLYLVVRSTRKADRRHTYRMSQAPGAPRATASRPTTTPRTSTTPRTPKKGA